MYNILLGVLLPQGFNIFFHQNLRALNHSNNFLTLRYPPWQCFSKSCYHRPFGERSIHQSRRTFFEPCLARYSGVDISLLAFDVFVRMSFYSPSVVATVGVAFAKASAIVQHTFTKVTCVPAVVPTIYLP